MTAGLRRGAAAATLLFALSACSGSGGGTGPSESPSGPPPTTSAAPTPTASRSPDPNFDYGQTVFIESTTVRPLWLISVVHRAVVFENESGAARRVVFDNADVHSDPIPPGGSWRFVPKTTVSLVYHLVGDPAITGRIQVTETEPMSG